MKKKLLLLSSIMFLFTNNAFGQYNDSPNALITNAFGNAGRQKLLNDIEAGNRLRAAQEASRREQDDYSRRYVDDVIANIFNNYSSLISSGYESDAALKLIKLRVDQQYKNITPDGLFRINNALTNKAKDLINAYERNGEHSRAVSLEKAFGLL